MEDFEEGGAGGEAAAKELTHVRPFGDGTGVA